VLVGPIAAPNWDLPSEASRSLAFGRPMDRPFYLERSRFDEQFAPALARFGGRQDLEWVRPDQAQCDAQRCLFVVEGHSLFADGNHLAAAELSRFRGVFEPALRKALGP